MIHFQLVSVYGVRQDHNFILLHVDIPTPFVDDAVFASIEWPWHHCRKSVGHNSRSLIWTPKAYPPACPSLFLAVPHGLDCYRFALSFEIMKCDSSYFILLCQDCSGDSRFAQLIFDKDLKVV